MYLQTRNVLSADPVATNVPSGFQAIERRLPNCYHLSRGDVGQTGGHILVGPAGSSSSTRVMIVGALKAAKIGREFVLGEALARPQ